MVTNLKSGAVLSSLSQVQNRFSSFDDAGYKVGCVMFHRILCVNECDILHTVRVIAQQTLSVMVCNYASSAQYIYIRDSHLLFVISATQHIYFEVLLSNSDISVMLDIDDQLSAFINGNARRYSPSNCRCHINVNI